MSDHRARGTEFLGRVIWQIWKDGQMYLAAALKKHRIGAGQYPLLMMLFNLKDLSQEEISRRLHIDKAATAKAVARLLKEGYVVRSSDASDRRRYRVSLSPAAASMRETLYAVNEEWERILLSGFDSAERTAVREALFRMRENASSSTKVRLSGRRPDRDDLGEGRVVF